MTKIDLPAGWFETERGVFWKHGGMWHPMSTAPRDGMPFLWLNPITVVGGGKSPRVKLHVDTLRRVGAPESEGYWTNSVISVADHAATHGWWNYAAIVTDDGRLVMPLEAFQYICEKESGKRP